MPRAPARQTALKKLNKVITARIHAAKQRYLLDEIDAFADDIDELLVMEREQESSSRYFVRSQKYRKRGDQWKLLLFHREFLDDTKFLSHFRVSRDAFTSIVNLIKEDRVFQSAAHHIFRGPAELHLMVLSMEIDGNENTAPKLALFLGLGKGSVGNYIDCAMEALLKLRGSAITWPDQDKRSTIADRIQCNFDFVSYVGMVDGTLLPLEFKPTKNGEDYF